MALDNLGNQVCYASDFTNGGEDIAYALYDLARAGRAAIGDLRYYLEARLDNFGSPLAKAQLGAALALYGDRTRAAEAFAAAVEGLKEQGRPLRAGAPTTAASSATPPRVLALAAEFTPSGVDLAALTKLLASCATPPVDLDAGRCLDADRRRRARSRDRRRLRSRSTAKSSPARSIAATSRSTSDENGTVTITNNGNTPTEVKVSVTGIPAVPPPATQQGFTIYA